MRKSLGFTLAEVLITLAIIGVVAAMTIPSVIVNTNQQEFKTGLKKAISVLNQAITMNIALDSETPADLVDNAAYSNYLQRRLNVIKTANAGDLKFTANSAFYTADGMRFEIPPADASAASTTFGTNLCGDGKGTKKNSAGTDVTRPCILVVDVNGDKKPTPADVNTSTTYKMPSPDGGRILDIFTIMITDTAAMPLGTVAQQTMFAND